jgi:glycosyltransferase involved in cell wall biosynthesis
MNPLLSIIIATKNRQKYAINAVESILSLQDNRIEVVLQDNSDKRDLESQLSKYKSDNRLIYRYTPPPFSSIDNFNAGIELSNGEYICLIGDDDGINPEIIEATAWAKDNNVDALVGSLSANYRWEGTGAPNTLFTKMTGGTLTITHFNGIARQAIVEESLSKLMKNGCTNYLDFSLPKLYHGIVRRDCMENIKTKTGAYLKGLSPDIYSSIALACVINRLVNIDYPLTIPGVCAESTSITEGQIKKHSKKLEDAPHFRDRSTYTWSEEVPKIYCVQTIWADSGFAALREMNRPDLIKIFNKNQLYANIIAADFTVYRDVLNHINTNFKGIKSRLFIDYLFLIQALLTGPFRKFLIKRVLGRVKIILGVSKFKTFLDLPTIHFAMDKLNNYLKTTNHDLNKELSKIK